MSEIDAAFCSWSGGKDCCLALDRFVQANPNTKIYLLTMLKRKLGKTYGHFVDEQLLSSQAKAMGFEIIFGYSDEDNYEEQWCIEIEKLKQRGVTRAVFGDIDLEEHYVWIERVMKKMALEMVMPLWLENRVALVTEAVEKGYLPNIISVRDGKCPEHYLGQIIDRAGIDSLLGDGVDPSAEGGEFHSFVTGGPLFSELVLLSSQGIERSNNHTYLKLC